MRFRGQMIFFFFLNIYNTLKAKMLVLLPLIHFILTDLFSPAWQKNVRQITYEVVEAMREASQKESSV